MGSRYGRRESLRALEVAFDFGINYVDAARAYGYGDAERILGEFIRGKRDRVVVATKFGIDPPKNSVTRRLAKDLARRVFRIAPQFRLAARSSLGRQFARPPLTREQMTRSVEASLRQLDTDRIDVLLIHDCSPDAVSDDDLFRGLEELVTAGKVRCLGASGDRAVVADALARRPILRIAQSRQGLFQSDGVGPTSCMSIVYSPFGGETGIALLRDLVKRVRFDAGAPSELRDRMRGARDDDAIAELAIAGARGAARPDVVLASMFSRRRIESNMRATRAKPLSAGDLSYLRCLVLSSVEPAPTLSPS